MQIFTARVTIGLAALVSVALEKVPATPGVLVATLLFAGAAFAHYKVIRLPRRLRRVVEVAQD